MGWQGPWDHVDPQRHAQWASWVFGFYGSPRRWTNTSSGSPLGYPPSPSVDDPAAYVEAIKQRLQLTHQQLTSPPIPPAANPYQVGSLIYALTTPTEHTSMLAPRWKGPYRVCRIPNEYQMLYEDGDVERTIHINHAKPAKFTAPDLPEPVPPPEAPRPPLGYLPAGFARHPAKPRSPPA